MSGCHNPYFTVPFKFYDECTCACHFVDIGLCSNSSGCCYQSGVRKYTYQGIATSSSCAPKESNDLDSHIELVDTVKSLKEARKIQARTIDELLKRIEKLEGLMDGLLDKKEEKSFHQGLSQPFKPSHLIGKRVSFFTEALLSKLCPHCKSSAVVTCELCNNKGIIWV